jgi:DNA gyrase/topoisomerase IV subunit A
MPPKAKPVEKATVRKRVSSDYTVDVDVNMVEEASGKFVNTQMFDFGRYTIEDRAVPDFRDGHKPVHRRLIYAMYMMQGASSATYMKSARVTGETMGKYHPHGSAYGSLVEMTWSRYPLVIGQGNFGSIKGDPAAAERYSECKVSKLVKHHFSCVDVAEMVPNYSGEFSEPLVINTRLPLLFMNGTSGIATGATTEIPSHNLGEICAAFEYVARNWKTANMAGIVELMRGPDFANGGVLLSAKDDVAAVYEHGTGPLRFSCDYKIEPDQRNPNVTNVVVSGFPDPFNVGSFIQNTIPKLKENRTIVGYREDYNKKTKELKLIVSVDNQSALKKVLHELQCQQTYRFNITIRSNEDEGGKTLFRENVPFITMAKLWLNWRKQEEEKIIELELKKLHAAKFLEDCKLLAMLNIQVLANAVQQTKIDPHEFVMKAMKVTREQAETMLKFRLIDLQKLKESELRGKIKDIELEITRVNKDLTQLMAVVVRHLRAVAKDSDERRTRVGGRMHDERRMQQSGDPLIFAATMDGKLLGAIDERGSSNQFIYAAPSFNGCAAFGASGLVGFFGPSNTGRAGTGLDKIVGIASREAKYLVAIGKNGFVNKVEQDMDSNRSIPAFMKDTEIVYGGGANDGDILAVWGTNGEYKAVKLNTVKTGRKNVRGQRAVNFEPSAALVIRRGQKMFTNDGNSLSVSSANGLGDSIPLAIGATRNLVVYKGGRRKIMDGQSVNREFRAGNIVAVYDATLPAAEATNASGQ